jgi:hypothetical protein
MPDQPDLERRTEHDEARPNDPGYEPLNAWPRGAGQGSLVIRSSTRQPAARPCAVPRLAREHMSTPPPLFISSRRV